MVHHKEMTERWCWLCGRPRLSLFYLFSFGVILFWAGSLDAGSLGAGSAGRLYSFGDSGIDTGNVLDVTQGFEPSAPYWEGRFSNGPNYLDGLAGAVPGWEALAWVYGGTNAAFGGARSGMGYAPGIEVPNVGEQVLQFQAESGESYTPLDMILFSMGQNDLLFAGDAAPQPAAVAKNMLEAFELAYENGARRFIFPTLFPLHLMPGVANDPSVDIAWVADWVAQVNAESDALIAGFKAAHPGVTVVRTDLTARISKVFTDPERYGIHNVTDSAYTGDFYGEGGSVVQDPDSYLWWDEAHVTATVQEWIAKWMLFDIQRALFEAQSSPQAGLASLLTLRDQVLYRNHREADRVSALWENNGLTDAGSLPEAGAWYLAPSGIKGRQDGDGVFDGWSWHSTGLYLAREMHLPGGGAGGISLGHSRGNLSLDNDAGDSDMEVSQAGVYAGFRRAPFFICLGGRYGYVDNQASRKMSLTGSTAFHRFHTHVFSGWTQAGLTFQKAGLTLSPLAGMAYLQTVSSTSTENGDGLLSYDSVEYPSTRHLEQRLGLRLSRARTWENGLTGRFTGRWSAQAAWHHEYLDNQSRAQVSHAGEVYGFSSPSKARDALGFGASLGLSRAEGHTLSVAYNGTWSRDALAQSLHLAFVLVF